MTNTTEAQPMLPGLELESPGQINGQTSMRVAVAETLRALHESRLLEPRHAGLAQLALELADAVSAGARNGRASATAMAAGQLRDTLLALPQPEDADASEAFQMWVQKTLDKEPPQDPSSSP